jgi:hypothetical protein
MEQHDLGELRPERLGYQPAKGYVRAFCLLFLSGNRRLIKRLGHCSCFVLTRVQIEWVETDKRAEHCLPLWRKTDVDKWQGHVIVLLAQLVYGLVSTREQQHGVLHYHAMDKSSQIRSMIPISAFCFCFCVALSLAHSRIHVSSMASTRSHASTIACTLNEKTMYRWDTDMISRAP